MREPVQGQSTLADWPILAARPPASDWLPPEDLPFLSGVDIGLDTEGRDDGISEERGAGWVYRAGYIAGVSVAWGGGQVYVPLRHPDTDCRHNNRAMEWVEHLLRNCRVFFFNMQYDMGWLMAEGCTVWPERAEDASAMAVMLDENHNSYSLESCCTREGIVGKDTELLDKAARAYGIPKKNGGYKHGIWRLPARYVGPYAEQDAAATLELGRRLLPRLEEQRMMGAYRTEMQLIPVVSKMRWRGIRIDDDAMELAQVETIKKRDELLSTLRSPVGRKTVSMEDLMSPERLAKIFDAEGVQYPRTAKTNQPSFTAEWLEAQHTPLATTVRDCRKLNDVANKFIKTYILGFQHRGRVHAEIHPLRGDSGGTVTTRFAYSSPPLQQMPARDPILGPLVRNGFLPEAGTLWYAPDYSQQEPRLAVHFASITDRRGAEEAVAYYQDRGEKADFHQMVSDLAGIDRKQAKIINLGLMYGMGIEKLARSLHLSKDDAVELMKIYHGKVPWVKALSEHAESLASTRGFIKLLDGARRHYDDWEPVRGKSLGSHRLERAKVVWPDQQLRRAYTRTAMNSLVQGSAARQTKISMVNCYAEGFLPMVQMHDELCFSVDNERDGRRIAEIMRESVQLRVPVRVDEEYGPRWGRAKYSFSEALSFGLAA